MKDSCDFPAFTAYCLGEQMLHIDMKKVKKLTALDVEQIYSCHEKIANGKKVYRLITFHGFIPMSDDAMAEAKKQSKRKMEGASAFVVSNFALRMSINFFMSFYKPQYPINICATKAEAVKWLTSVKKKMDVTEMELV